MDSKHYITIIIALKAYKNMMDAILPPSEYCRNEKERIDLAINWLNDQLEFLEDYRHEAREEN